jgi:hypothetical protein
VPGTPHRGIPDRPRTFHPRAPRKDHGRSHRGSQRIVDETSDETDHEVLREQLRSISEGLLAIEDDEDTELEGSAWRRSRTN